MNVQEDAIAGMISMVELKEESATPAMLRNLL
jgi:hypothetical protein